MPDLPNYEEELEDLHEIGANPTMEFLLDLVKRCYNKYVRSPRWFFDFLFGKTRNERLFMGTALLAVGSLPAHYVAWGELRLAAYTAVSITVVILFMVLGGLYRWRQAKSRIIC